MPSNFGRAWSSFTYVDTLKSFVIIGGEDDEGVCQPEVGIISVGAF
jgi:hypothetical protein